MPFAAGDPRFGSGPVNGANIERDELDKDWRLDGAGSGGGGMSCEAALVVRGLDDVSTLDGLSATDKDALCAEFGAGKDGGGMSGCWPSSPSASTSASLSRERESEGTAVFSIDPIGRAFGVVCSSSSLADAFVRFAPWTAGLGAENQLLHVVGEWQITMNVRSPVRMEQARSISVPTSLQSRQGRRREGGQEMISSDHAVVRSLLGSIKRAQYRV